MYDGLVVHMCWLWISFPFFAYSLTWVCVVTFAFLLVKDYGVVIRTCHVVYMFIGWIWSALWWRCLLGRYRSWYIGNRCWAWKYWYCCNTGVGWLFGLFLSWPVVFPVEDISDQVSVCSGEQRVYIWVWIRDPALVAVYSRFSEVYRDGYCLLAREFGLFTEPWHFVFLVQGSDDGLKTWALTVKDCNQPRGEIADCRLKVSRVKFWYTHPTTLNAEEIYACYTAQTQTRLSPTTSTRGIYI
jgi:hypothetical protein